MKQRYIFFDIDGTLKAGGYGGAYIPDSTKEALTRLRAAGHKLAIATGRSEAMARGYLEELGFENMVSDGGYGITIDGELRSIESLPKELVIRLVDECKEHNIPWALQVNNSVVRQAPDKRFKEFTHDIYMDTEIIEGLDPRDYDKIYKVYVACYEEDEKRLKSLNDLSWCRWMDEYIFVETADKAY